MPAANTVTLYMKQRSCEVLLQEELPRTVSGTKRTNETRLLGPIKATPRFIPPFTVAVPVKTFKTQGTK
jgi:hypothetical protein